MRFILRISLPVEPFNASVRDGTAPQRMARILEETKPEAAYFVADGGKRSALLVIDMEKTSEMPRLAEPWFLHFGATVEFLPAMTPEDLGKAGIEDLGRKWK